MSQIKGYVNFILHAHLPFVFHPYDDTYLEEEWLFEAISETYIPLLKSFEALVDEGVDFRITMSMTPPLLNMLDNEILKKRYVKYLKKHIELSEKEIERTKDNERINRLSHYYYNRYKEDLRYYLEDANGGDIISRFKFFQDIGKLEIITCGATHGYFPILYINEKTVDAQIAVGVQTYEHFFGRKPKGIWLPECGYVPEVDKLLKKHGIQYAIVETHGLLYAEPLPVNATYTPIVSPDGLVAFARDLESSRQVWSSISGYPGDFNYREFYRDIGYDAPYDYIKPYIASNGVRVNTGIKYHRITGKTEDKDIYDVQWAKDSAEMQAGDFYNCRTDQINHLSTITTIPPIITCPYDAELYGHWWYEGPYWLYILFKKIHYNKSNFELITPSEYLEKYPNLQVSTPARSSWGANGYSEVWLNSANDYAFKHFNELGKRMTELANQYKDNTDSLIERVLNQCARELLMLQSSDWLFIITNQTMVDYAHKKIKEHTGRFNELYEQLTNNRIEEEYLKDVELKTPIFPYINFKVYAN